MFYTKEIVSEFQLLVAIWRAGLARAACIEVTVGACWKVAVARNSIPVFTSRTGEDVGDVVGALDELGAVLGVGHVNIGLGACWEAIFAGRRGTVNGTRCGEV